MPLSRGRLPRGRVKEFSGLLCPSGLLCLFDLSAAFHTVDHLTLLQSLCISGGINGTALSWFSLYKKYTSFWKDSTSDQISLEHGVPQDSVLGPLLFVIYTIGIDSIFSRHNFHAHMYVYDIEAYAHRPSFEQTILGRTTGPCLCHLPIGLLQ